VLAKQFTNEHLSKERSPFSYHLERSEAESKGLAQTSTGLLPNGCPTRKLVLEKMFCARTDFSGLAPDSKRHVK